ncbi:RDD family protein [Gloeomargarita lithophora Alchichica-D10]|uniref:RDD family protein n=1 Tax=Gloeomargarita lithophora Alchichica-D10 TaxID=1188229 RepID=A0A1J0ABY3_9CYAN|nr:RDD family protein [Gloeomargarita lithophora]APB33460.1 RDD family protein [Gloeomargarita lithophora Alchichica-D10]
MTHPFWRSLKIATPEHTELELLLAGPGNRAYALAVDYLCLGLALVLEAILIYAIVVSEFLDNFADENGDISGALLWLAALGFLGAFLIYTGYFVWFETLWQGQTPGKKLAHIRVIREDGRPVGLQEATLRTLLRIVDDLFLIGAYFVIFGKREKRIGDFVAGTLVIQEAVTQNQRIQLPEAVEEMGEDLVPVAAHLAPDELVILRDYVQRCGRFHPLIRQQLARELAQQLQERLNCMDDGSDPDMWLHALYWAYQQQSVF